jgi:diguanylate cyclase (GGDEF)-like protein
MKEFSPYTKAYLCVAYLSGIVTLVWHLAKGRFSDPVMLTILCLLASLALLFKVEGTTHRSHYTFSFLVYGFTFALYGTSTAILVIAISNLTEWLWRRPPWFIQLFNSACYILLMQVAGFLYHLINPENALSTWQTVVGFVASMAVFDLLNHGAVGIVLWLARGENFKKSGVFYFVPLMLDLTLLYFGGILAFAWNLNHFTPILSLVPIYLTYGTLHVPALQRQTELDSKTGLFNHEYFKVQLQHELHRANRYDRPLAVIMADLDLLRNINNTYGHLAGDEVLIGVAKVLKQSVGEYDIVSRFGGEEFAILLPETSLTDAYTVAEQIRKTIEDTKFITPTHLEGIHATMSFGIARREGVHQSPEEITYNADSALYRSKSNGRNRVYVFSDDVPVDFDFLKDEEKTLRIEMQTEITQPSG